MNKNEIDALISLLDDPDEIVYSSIKERLLSIGHEAIPELEAAWENSFEPIIQNRIENIIHHIQFKKIAVELNLWAKSPKQNLLQGVLLIAKYQYPDLNEDKITKQLEQIKQDVWLELNNNLTALEKIKVINHILFDIHNFSGNTAHYHAPQNSYINNVLESKKGNPLSLSILYIIIAQELRIPVYGINLPEHFVLGYIDLSPDQSVNVLFYINAFSKGAVFSKKEIDLFLQQLKVPPYPSFYKPCSNLEVITRLLRNLIYSYEKLGYPDKIEELKTLLESLN